MGEGESRKGRMGAGEVRHSRGLCVICNPHVHSAAVTWQSDIPSTPIMWGFSHSATHSSGTPSWVGIPSGHIEHHQMMELGLWGSW